MNLSSLILFLQEDPDLLFHLCWSIKRNKTYKRCTVNNAGSKFNMKHSLKPRTSSALGRARRSTDRWGPHRQPPSSPPAAAFQLHPGALSPLCNQHPTTSHTTLSNTAHCTIFQTFIKYVTMHNFEYFLTSDVSPIFLLKINSGIL